MHGWLATISSEHASQLDSAQLRVAPPKEKIGAFFSWAAFTSAECLNSWVSERLSLIHDQQPFTHILDPKDKDVVQTRASPLRWPTGKEGELKRAHIFWGWGRVLHNSSSSY